MSKKFVCYQCENFVFPAPGNHEKDRGTCHADAPLAVVGEMKLRAPWPVVGDDDWCAKFDGGALNRRCDVCQFHDSRMSSAADERGECRRHAPVLDLDGVFVWPTTKKRDSCGDFALHELERDED